MTFLPRFRLAPPGHDSAPCNRAGGALPLRIFWRIDPLTARPVLGWTRDHGHSAGVAGRCVPEPAAVRLRARRPEPLATLTA
ncbi:MAG: hypothetical protein JJU42_02820 [Rhodobacteraceae bacterium]|nr:hypothetical protein [Paracoccaceae bacterium]